VEKDSRSGRKDGGGYKQGRRVRRREATERRRRRGIVRLGVSSHDT
jgi:hypothetical protein